MNTTLKIAEFEAARCQVAIIDNGEGDLSWAVLRDRRCFRWSPAISDQMPFLSILEEDLTDVCDGLRRGLSREGREPTFAETFPVSDIVALGLASRSQKWIQRATEWVDAVPLTPVLERAILELLERRDGTQGERQRARRRLKGPR